MYAVMAAVAVSAVVNTAARYDGDIAVVAHIEIVVYHFRQSALA